MRALAVALVLSLAASSSGCARLVYNFGTVEEARIYRSAQPSPLFLRWLVWRHDIKTLVNLRGGTPGYESAFAARNRMRVYSFKMRSSKPPTEAEVQRFLAILDDPENYPILIHCRAGVDRTGYMVGLYRVREQGWDPQSAVHEMNRYGQFSQIEAVPQQVVRDGLRRPDPRTPE